MSPGVKPRRAYVSPQRREQARATRRAILQAARGLFMERGYVATTVEAIAARAALSPATVYLAFVSKRALLAALVDESIGGDDAPVALLDRPWVQQLRSEPDRRRRIRLLAHNGRLILERRSPIDEVLHAAASTDPEIRALWERGRAERMAGQRALLQTVAGAGGVRPGLSMAAAADILYAVGSPEVYRSLTGERGWSPARFERWYADTIERLLFA